MNNLTSCKVCLQPLSPKPLSPDQVLINLSVAISETLTSLVERVGKR